MVKLLFDGVLFNQTGVARMHRGVVKELIKKGVDVQLFDFYDKDYDNDNVFVNAYKPINFKDLNVWQVLTYNPDVWATSKIFPGKHLAWVVHEGNMLKPGWSEVINNCDHVVVSSKATKNLFFSSGVRKPISVVPLGVDPKIFNPDGDKAKLHIPMDDDYVKQNYPKLNNPFIFLSVNSWTGEKGDRKGTDLLIRAFSEEFSKDENVVLYLKVSTFWSSEFDVLEKVKKLSPPGERAMILSTQSNNVLPDEHLAELFRVADCFVSPTLGESWGLSIGESLACGTPVIVPENEEAGYTDFCNDNPAVFYCKTGGRVQADLRFFSQGNTMPVPDVSDLRKVMRKVFEMSKDERDSLGKRGSEVFLKDFSWEKSAEKFLGVFGDE